MKARVPSKLLLFDGHAYAYRAFHAIRSLSSPDGSPTNAIFGFLGMLSRALSFLKPTHAAVVWDGGLSPDRRRLVPEYKAQRPPMPEFLTGQIGELQQFLPDFGVRSLCLDEVEADDWIGTLALRMAASGGQSIVASSDKDFMQLVSERVGLLNPNTKPEMVWGEAEVVAKTGVKPCQIVDWLSLMGDAVDNIAGVPGIGPKTAAEILTKFSSIDALYSRIAEVKPDRIRQALVAAEEKVRRNQQVVRLHLDQAEPSDLDELLVTPPSWGRLVENYQRWGFRRLLEEAESRNRPQLELLTGI